MSQTNILLLFDQFLGHFAVAVILSFVNYSYFRWTFNDSVLPSNTDIFENLTSSVLTIKKANNSNNGAYTCEVKNPDVGMVYRDTAYVDVTGKPYSFRYVLNICAYLLHADPSIRVDIEQDFFEVSVNSSVELICRYSSDFLSTIIRWRRTNGIPLPQQAVVSYLDEASLSTIHT